jgi:hypothetical protein
MVPFDHVGRDWIVKNRFRKGLMMTLLAVEAIVLLPLSLLMLGERGMERLAQRYQ